MQLLEHVTMATTPTGDSQDQDIVHVITGVWDPRETSFAVLNKETPHDLNSVYLTIGKRKVEAVQPEISISRKNFYYIFVIIYKVTYFFKLMYGRKSFSILYGT